MDKIKNFAKNIQGRTNGTVNLRILTILSLLILFLVVVYTGNYATKIQLNNGDQFVSAAIFGDIDQGTPMVASGHTNVIKAPVLWLQDQLPQTFSLYAFINIAFILLSILLWTFLCGRVFGKKYIPILLLGFSAVLINSPALAVDLAMSTIRHIEYPLAFIFLLGLKSSIDALGRRKLVYSITSSLLLGVLLVNDKFFLYTLVPAAIVGSLLYIKKINIRSVLIHLAPIFIGILSSVIIIKLLNTTGLIYITSGYAEANHIIKLESLIESLTLTTSQTLNMFGGLIFGQEIRKNNISIAMGFIVCIVSFVGIYLAFKKRAGQSYHPIHLYLALLALFTYCSYIAPNFVSANNTRYLSGVVYIGLTFFTYAILHWNKKWKYTYVIVCVFLISLIILSFPRTNNFYTNSLHPIERDNLRTKLTVNSLEGEKINTVVTAGGHYSLWFYSNATLTVVQLQETCNTPSPWANNSSWLKPENKQRSAFLVDQSYPEKAGRTCGIREVEKIYGNAEKIIPLPKPGETDTSATSYLLIYDYDIRSKFNTALIPTLR